MRPRPGSTRQVRGLSTERGLLHEHSEVDRRVAQGRSQGPGSDPAGGVTTVAGRRRPTRETLTSAAIGLVLVAIALVVYSHTKPFRFYDHFEWQAEAFLEGQTAIRYPVEATDDSPGNAFFNDVRQVPSNDGVPRGDIPFPPLPAILLLPFVAAWGHRADGQFIFAVVGAIDVGIAWWALGGLPIRRWVRLATTVFLAFGTVLWYAAQIGTTWYQAHVLAVGLALLAVGVALRADPDAATDEDDLPEPEPTPQRESETGQAAGCRGIASFASFGRASTAASSSPGCCSAWPARRVSRCSSPRRSSCSSVAAGRGCGGASRPGSERRSRSGRCSSTTSSRPATSSIRATSSSTSRRPGFYTTLGYNLSWGIEDPRYIPQNLGIMLFSAPAIEPTIYPAGLGGGRALCADPAMIRGLFEPDCPMALPLDTGMSVILTSPAFLFALPALRRYGRSRAVTGAALAVLIIAVVNLMHFSQGWVQFGYRFSLDFVPWALVLVALGMERIRSGTGVAIAVVLVGTLDRRQLVGRGLGQPAGMVKRARLALLAPVGVGVIATALAAWRLMPGVGFWDTAEFQTIPPILGTAHPTGYPTYVILGWLASIVLAPFGEPAFRMNLLSAILVGVAAGITVDLVRLLTRSTIIGVAAGLGLAATPIVWVDRHPCRPPCAPPRVVRRPSSGCSSAGRSPGSRTRRAPTAGSSPPRPSPACRPATTR